MAHYRELTVWQKSMDLVVLIYKLSQDFPVQEQYGLTSQMRRSAVSIPSSIAEGSRRRGTKDIRNFMVTAYASGSELETQLEISRRLNYGNKSLFDEASALLDQVMRMLNRMVNGT